MENKVSISEMTIADYDQVIRLWSVTEGLGLSEADTRENIERFLQRNKGLSLVAKVEAGIIGAVLAGHDGRRGYLHHLCVSSAYRRNGIGRQLLNHCLAKLKEQGIKKCHIFVFTDNLQGLMFWNNNEFKKREELYLLSKNLD